MFIQPAPDERTLQARRGLGDTEMHENEIETVIVVRSLLRVSVSL